MVANCVELSWVTNLNEYHGDKLGLTGMKNQTELIIAQWSSSNKSEGPYELIKLWKKLQESKGFSVTYFVLQK